MRSNGSASLLALASVVGLTLAGALGYGLYSKFGCTTCVSEEQAAVLAEQHEHTGDCCPLHSAGKEVAKQEKTDGCASACEGEAKSGGACEAKSTGKMTACGVMLPDLKAVAESGTKAQGCEASCEKSCESKAGDCTAEAGKGTCCGTCSKAQANAKP